MGRKRVSRTVPATIKLEDGSGEYVGDGMVVVLQRDEDTRKTQSVVLTRQDLEALLAAAA